MKKSFLPALFAAALLLSLPACGPSDSNPQEDVVTNNDAFQKAQDAAYDSTKSQDVNRELTAPNATEDIKKMQPQM